MTIPAKKDENSIYIDHEQRITRLETNNHNIPHLLLKMEKRINERFEEINNKFDETNKKIERINSKFEIFESRLWANFYWTIGGFAAILAVMAHGFKWI